MATIPNIILNGTTADANQVMADFTEIYTNIDETNIAASAKTGTGDIVLQVSPTITTPTISSPTISGTIAGPLAFSGNITFDTNTLFVDATNDFVGIRRLTSNSIATTPLDVLTSGTNIAAFESTSAGNTGPTFIFYHNSASPAANDAAAIIRMYGNSSTGTLREYATVQAIISDPTNGSEDSNLIFQTMVGGAAATRGGFFGDALFVGRTSANAITPTALDVFTQNNEVAMFENNISGAGGPAILTYHNSASPAVSDLLGSYQFYGNSDSGVKRKYVSIASQILDPTNASEDSQIIFQTMAAGTIATRFTVGNTFVSTTTDFIIPSTNKLSLNAGGTSYISETSAGVVEIFAGGTSMLRFLSPNLIDTTGAVSFALFGDITPKTDNTYVLGNSLAAGDASNKRWARINCNLIYTTAGASWDMGGFTAGADVASNGYVTVTVNGTARKLMTTA